jgi:hypothetical protein
MQKGSTAVAWIAEDGFPGLGKTCLPLVGRIRRKRTDLTWAEEWSSKSLASELISGRQDSNSLQAGGLMAGQSSDGEPVPSTADAKQTKRAGHTPNGSGDTKGNEIS